MSIQSLQDAISAAGLCTFPKLESNHRPLKTVDNQNRVLSADEIIWLPTADDYLHQYAILHIADPNGDGSASVDVPLERGVDGHFMVLAGSDIIFHLVGLPSGLYYASLDHFGVMADGSTVHVRQVLYRVRYSNYCFVSPSEDVRLSFVEDFFRDLPSFDGILTDVELGLLKDLMLSDPSATTLLTIHSQMRQRLRLPGSLTQLDSFPECFVLLLSVAVLATGMLGAATRSGYLSFFVGAGLIYGAHEVCRRKHPEFYRDLIKGHACTSQEFLDQWPTVQESHTFLANIDANQALAKLVEFVRLEVVQNAQFAIRVSYEGTWVEETKDGTKSDESSGQVTLQLRGGEITGPFGARGQRSGNRITGSSPIMNGRADGVVSGNSVRGEYSYDGINDDGNPERGSGTFSGVIGC